MLSVDKHCPAAQSKLDDDNFTNVYSSFATRGIVLADLTSGWVWWHSAMGGNQSLQGDVRTPLLDHGSNEEQRGTVVAIDNPDALLNMLQQTEQQYYARTRAIKDEIVSLEENMVTNTNAITAAYEQTTHALDNLIQKLVEKKDAHLRMLAQEQQAIDERNSLIRDIWHLVDQSLWNTVAAIMGIVRRGTNCVFFSLLRPECCCYVTLHLPTCVWQSLIYVVMGIVMLVLVFGYAMSRRDCAPQQHAT